METGEDPRVPADVHHVVGTEQGQNRDDGAHEQRAHGQADQELAQCRPAPAELNDGPTTDEAHQQPISEQGQGHCTDRDDERDTRPPHRSATGTESSKTSRYRQQPDGHLSADDDRDSQKELEPAEALRLPWGNTPLGTDRNEPVQETNRPRFC